jgi:SAM-dependent methyltransferase
MRWAPAALAEAQSFDRVAAAYDRLGELHEDRLIDRWLEGQLPTAGRRALDLGCGTGRHAVLLAGRFDQVDATDVSGPMIDLAARRRPRPNISYRRADLHDIDGTGQYDFVLSVLALHHVPDLRAALSHIKTLLAPGGRAVLVDIYVAGPPRLLERLTPLRARLHGLAVYRLATNLVRRGPVTAWEIYRLSTRRAWLDHRVTDRFFGRDELDRYCQALFPGYRLDILGGPRGIGLVWNAPF